MCGVLALFFVYTFSSESFYRSVFFILFLLSVPVDILRLAKPAVNDVLIHLFRPIMRQHELKRLAGTSYLITGVNLIALLFPRPIVAITLLFLAFADPIASWVGIKYGKDKIFGHKSIQGFMAAFAVCVVVSLAYLTSTSMLLDHLWIVSILGGLVGALAELIPIGKLDDNLSLPILSCIGLSLIFRFFGWYVVS